MTLPRFIRQPHTSPLYLLDEPALALSGQTVAFVPLSPTGEPPAREMDELSLAQTWMDLDRYPGLYLVCNVAIAEAQIPTVISQIHAFTHDPAMQQTRFLWVEDPVKPLSQWRFTAMATVPTAEVAVQTVKQLTFFDFRNYALVVAPGVECRLTAGEDGFVLTAGADLAVAKTPFYVSTGYGAEQLTGIEGPITLPWTGQSAGCLQFQLTLALPNGMNAYAQLTHLDIALRMFFKEFDPALASPESTVPFLITAHRYPLFAETADAVPHYAEPLRFHVSLDPLQPLPRSATAATRTYFAFWHPDQPLPQFGSNTLTAQAVSYPRFPSCYRTNLGYTVYLTPHTHATRLVFAECPTASNAVFAPPFYLVPEGEFVLSVPWQLGNEEASHGSGEPRDGELLYTLLGGLSGAEFIRLEPDRLNLLSFQPDQPAFLPTFRPHLQPEQQTAAPAPLPDVPITRQAQTAWAFVRQQTPEQTSEAAVYYAQPELALLYKASEITDTNQDATDNLLSFLDIPVTRIPTPERPRQDAEPSTATAPEWGFPLLPYGGVDGAVFYYEDPRDAGYPLNALGFYRQLEQQYINPTRRSRIVDLSQTDNTPLGDSEAPDAEGVTPQGFLTTYTGDFETVKSILLAKDTAGQVLKFEGLPRRVVSPQVAAGATEARDAVAEGVPLPPLASEPTLRSLPLRDAFQSNQMFLVISDPSSFFENRDPNSGTSYFRSNQLTIQDWTFNLDPDTWRPDTILIFKFFDKPLVELIADETLWSFKDDFNNRDSVRQELIDLFQAVQKRGSADATARDRENYEYLARAIELESWSGILALNVQVPPKHIPDDLKALVAGINKEEFYAQYLVIETTPVLPVQGKLQARQSSMFALIDYQDNSIPPVGPDGYAFQVSMLRVLFQNSQIKAFSSEINVTLDQLFNEQTRLLNSRTGRNLVVLKGTAENHNGTTRYTYSFSGENFFAMPDSHVLDNITIVKANFTTDPLPPANDGKVNVTGRFAFWGQFNFRALDKFDAFSFGADFVLDKALLKHNSGEKNALENNTFFESDADREQRRQDLESLEKTVKQLQENKQVLPFSDLHITMKFELAASEEDGGDAAEPAPPLIPQFTFDASRINYDLKRSQFRPTSLYGMFPIKLSGFVQITEATQPTGFMAVKNPLGSGGLPAQGYGFVYDLNLGSLGALTGSMQLVVRLLLAWTPNTEGDQDNASVFVGMQLPGIGGDVLGFPLQSVIKLSFKSLEFVVDRNPKTDTIRGYLLKLSNLALKLLVLSLPPSGQTELIIFGNPKLSEDAALRGKPEAVGWYAAYAKDPTPPNANQPARASPGQR